MQVAGLQLARGWGMDTCLRVHASPALALLPQTTCREAHHQNTPADRRHQGRRAKQPEDRSRPSGGTRRHRDARGGAGAVRAAVAWGRTACPTCVADSRGCAAIAARQWLAASAAAALRLCCAFARLRKRAGAQNQEHCSKRLHGATADGAIVK